MCAFAFDGFAALFGFFIDSILRFALVFSPSLAKSTCAAKCRLRRRRGQRQRQLGAQARTALSRAQSHKGDKGRTQVKRALVKQTGIKYGAVDKAMATAGALATGYAIRYA
jgi:hypothetical protein